MLGERGNVTDVVVDPGVPEEDAQLLRESSPLIVKIRKGWVPRPPMRIKAGNRVAATLGWLAVLGVMGLMVFTGLVTSGPGIAVLGVVGFVSFAVFFSGRQLADEEEEIVGRGVYERVRWYEGRYVLVEDLDESSQRLLVRARRAIYAVMTSVVNAEGLLDDVRNAVMLPAQEWEIARLLAKLSDLRAKHRQTVSEGVSPEVAAVAEPLVRALDSSEAAVVARVEALERYAENVADAERAYRAHHQIEELRGRLHQYEELVAESGADGFAVPEISQLAQDADQLEQALRRSVRSAHEAFRYLDG